MAQLSPFYETRDFYLNYLDYNEPLSFEEWNNKPHELKAAFLFVQFFPEILSAWAKVNYSDFVEGEQGVSIVNQYLEKNVPKISENPKRFSPWYVYRVAYNCMYCICYDVKATQNKWKYEIPETVVKDGDEFSLYDTVVDESSSAYAKVCKNNFEKEFWSIIEDSGLDTEKALRYLLSGDPANLKKLSKRNKDYNMDPLRDIEVSLESVGQIVEQLKNKFLQLPKDSILGSYLVEMLATAS